MRNQIQYSASKNKNVMLKKISKFLLLAPLLMAFQCDDDIEPTLVYNTYTTNVTPASSFPLTETIWIEGKVSSKVFDLSVNDSIFTETPQIDVFSVYKFMEPNATSNCKDAFDQFDLVFEIGEFNFLPRCENAEVHVFPELETEGAFYTYRLGLKPKNTGDFLICLLYTSPSPRDA